MLRHREFAQQHYLRLAPFTFIHTQKFTESEHISGVPSFGAESKRTIALLQKLQALQLQDEASVNRLSIVFLDELFSNTSPGGCLGAITYMHALDNFSRNIRISSTHYQQLVSPASQYPGTFRIFPSVLKSVPEVVCALRVDINRLLLASRLSQKA